MEDPAVTFGIVVAALTVLLPILCTVAILAGLFGGAVLLWRRIQHVKGREAAAYQASLSWPSTSGRVLKSRVEVSGVDATRVKARIVYEYEVHGRRYESDRLRAGEPQLIRVTRPEEPYDLVDRYPVGATITVYYNPVNPTEAALER